VQIWTLPVGPLQANCHILAADSAGACVVVDPGQDAEGAVAATVAEHGLRPEAVLLTHGHLDHVADARTVCDRFGIPAYVHPADRHLLTDPLAGLGPAFADLLVQLTGRADGGLTDEPETVVELADGDDVELAGTIWHITLAPGHTAGSVIITCPDGPGQAELVLSGDVLFAGSVGRTDLPGGDPDVMTTTLRERVLTLDDQSTVLTGHGRTTTIAAERRTNPFLRHL